MHPEWLWSFTPSSSVIHSPTLFLIALIRFLCLLTTVEVWKKEVLRSPKVVQFSRDFIAQNSSSWSIIRLYSSVSYFSRWTRKSLGLLARAFWVPLSLASTFFFLVNKFPRTSTFHLLTSLVKLVIAEDNGWRWSQLSLTNLENSRWRNHVDWNLKGLFLAVRGDLLSSRRIGQWSK